eukprot:CAMPEP_0179445220 /NCGR_PEP_ID=MMETSP0799-20121207/28676_1 /TAXON_ID=46947 /ORGANISM="Geminigera cryophila, Strain CCMP2564" /LENGTH=446 /DNA_ID=CAMNT_0021233065 /DNA_START=166 /DNA_END=1502 /DNA_ORIENTATION=+
MSWWGQREVMEDAWEHQRSLEKLVERISAGYSTATTYDALHQLVDLTPVDNGKVVSMLVSAMAAPKLNDESRWAISTAIERLFKRHDAALGGLVGLLEHVKDEIRSSASDLLSRLVKDEQQAKCVRDIAARLDNIAGTTRTAVIHCLHNIVANSGHLHKLCVAGLCEKLKSMHAYSRDSAIDGLVLLARMGQRDDLIIEVVGCLQHPNAVVRTYSVRAVGALVNADPKSYQSWVKAAAECMDHKDGPIRTTGREALAEIGSVSSKGASAGRTGLVKESFNVWDLGYGKQGCPCIVDDPFLQEPAPQKGVDATSSNSRATVVHVGMRLEDPNPSVRDSAVASLCALRDEGEHSRMDLICCSALRLDYDDDDVRSTAVTALSQLVRGDVAEEVEVILDWLERPADSSQGNTANNTRVYAVKALGNVAKYNDARVVKALLSATSDPDYR